MFHILVRRDGSKRVSKKKTFLLILIGRTGEGKSATGNLLLGRVGFKSKVTARSVTPECSEQLCSIDGRNVRIIDTPGLFDTSNPNEETKNKILSRITRYLQICSKNARE